MVASRTLVWRLIAGALAFITTSTNLAQTASQPAATMPTDAELHASLEALLKKLDELKMDLGDVGLSDATTTAKINDAAINGFDSLLRARSLDENAAAMLRRDAITLRNEAAPRLTGNILRVGAGQPFKDLADAQAAAKSGDLIILPEGVFNLAGAQVQTPMNDVAIVGAGVNKTTIAVSRNGGLMRADRMLVESVRIDCANNPFTDVRKGHGFMLRGCELMNYNSGNSLGANAGVVWIESCLFDGSGGRASRPGRGASLGDALDLRAAALLFARRCQFVDNDEIVRATVPTMFDGCTMLNQTGVGYGVAPYAEGEIWLRESDSVVTRRLVTPPGANPRSFTHATDDIEFIDFVLDPSKPIDDDSKQLANTLQLHRRLPYWIGLIHHDDARIRELAAKKVRDLTGQEVNLPKEPPREGERLADAGVLLEIEKEYARLMNWLDANAAKLKWDDAAGRYRIEDQSKEQPK